MGGMGDAAVRRCLTSMAGFVQVSAANEQSCSDARAGWGNCMDVHKMQRLNCNHLHIRNALGG